MISVSEACAAIVASTRRVPVEEVKLTDAVGRTLAVEVQADRDSPPHDKSVMDGFAIRSADFSASGQKFRVVETITAGAVPTKPLGPNEAARIMTGAPIPVGSDAVVMVEQTNPATAVNNPLDPLDPLGPSASSAEYITLEIESIQPEKHILRAGANFPRHALMFDRGHVVRPPDVGLLAEVGATALRVYRNPTVAVLPTGNELVDCSERPQAGQIRNSNGPMLLAMARSRGLPVTDLGIGRDDRASLSRLIERGLRHDVLLLSGGVSAGTLDLVPLVLQELGVTEIFHKVKVKPGKPIWFGVHDDGDHRCYVFGLPGNPVSSLVGFRLFVVALIDLMTGTIPVDETEPRLHRFCQHRLSANHETRGDRPTYWPGKLLVHDSPERIVEPLVWNGSSDLFSLGKADGLIYFPGETHRHMAGEIVKFLAF